jgi:hypothetical protein
VRKLIALATASVADFLIVGNDEEVLVGVSDAVVVLATLGIETVGSQSTAFCCTSGVKLITSVSTAIVFFCGLYDILLPNHPLVTTLNITSVLCFL